jgi:hypothetical protein
MCKPNQRVNCGYRFGIRRTPGNAKTNSVTLPNRSKMTALRTNEMTKRRPMMKNQPSVTMMMPMLP